jgi:hypothetical protein
VRNLILHCFNTLRGSEVGFADSGLFMFELKSTQDYHEEMTGEVFFFKWFQSILPDSSSSNEKYNEEEEGEGSMSGIKHL